MTDGPFDAAHARRVQWICRIVLALAVLNFLAYGWVTSAWGGDAWHGKIIGDSCYLNAKGRLTPVDCSVFRAIDWHGRSLFVSHPVAMVAALVAHSYAKALRALDGG